MRTTTRQEKEHIKKRRVLFYRALEKAALSLRNNSKLVGLDNVRDDIALHAALKATGFAIDPFVPKVGPVTQEFMDITVAAYWDAVAQADKVNDGNGPGEV